MNEFVESSNLVEEMIDYVGGRITTPSKKDFDQLMEDIHGSDKTGFSYKDPYGRDVSLDQPLSIEEKDTLNRVLPRVYKNKRNNINKVLKGAALVLGFVILRSIFASSRSENSYDDISIVDDDTVVFEKDDKYYVLSRIDDVE